MFLSLAEYVAAIPDLHYPLALHRVGTCPSCGNFGMTLKLLQQPRPHDGAAYIYVYEPWCPFGCPRERIEQACRLLLAEAVSAGGD